MPSNVEGRITEIIAEQLGMDVSDIHQDSTFIDDLAADSLDIVEMIMAIEEEFEIEIPDEDAETLLTVQQTINYVESKIE